MQSPYLGASVLNSPVALIVTESNLRANVATISFFSEVAHHPTTLWISIANGSLTHEMLRSTGRFTLTVLHEGQRQIAQSCGTISGRLIDKTKCLTLQRAEGHLYFAEGLASVACSVRSTFDLSDHTLFVADILAGKIETRNSYRRHLLVSDLLEC